MNEKDNIKTWEDLGNLNYFEHLSREYADSEMSVVSDALDRAVETITGRVLKSYAKNYNLSGEAPAELRKIVKGAVRSSVDGWLYDDYLMVD